MFLTKFLVGVGGQGFQEKLPGGGSPISGFIAFLFTSVSKFALPLPPPHPYELM
jgi:hypothetical protein